MKKSTSSMIVVGLCAVLFNAAGAFGEEQYRAEVTVGVDYSKSGDFKTTTFGAAGEFFFEPVKTGEHPYAEAAFFARIPSVFAEFDIVNIDSGAGNADGPAFLVGGQFANPNFPVTASVAFSKSRIEWDVFFANETDTDAIDVTIGAYLMPTLHAGIRYGHAKSEMDTLFGSSTFKETEVGPFAKYVHELGHGMELALEAAASQVTEDFGGEKLKNVVVELAADYYLNRSLSAGILIGRSGGEIRESEGLTFGVNARYFITPQFSARVGYERFENVNDPNPFLNEEFENANMYSVMGSARF